MNNISANLIFEYIRCYLYKIKDFSIFSLASIGDELVSKALTKTIDVDLANGTISNRVAIGYDAFFCVNVVQPHNGIQHLWQALVELVNFRLERLKWAMR